MHIPDQVLKSYIAAWISSVSDIEAERVQTVAHSIGTDPRISDEGSAAMVTASLLALSGAPVDVRIIGGFWSRLYFRMTNN